MLTKIQQNLLVKYSTIFRSEYYVQWACLKKKQKIDIACCECCVAEHIYFQDVGTRADHGTSACDHSEEHVMRSSTPSSASCREARALQPLFAAGLIGLGWAMLPIATCDW